VSEEKEEEQEEEDRAAARGARRGRGGESSGRGRREEVFNRSIFLCTYSVARWSTHSI
jgi:hypothetical protein